MRLRLPARLLGLLAVVTLAVASPGVAGPATSMRCVGAPFSFSDVNTTKLARQGRHVLVAWGARGTTTFACQDSGVISLDVWEHAYATLGPAGDGSRSAQLLGFIQVRVSVPDGGTVLLGGIIQGSGPCAGAVCDIDAEVRAGERGEARLRMLERVQIDLTEGTITEIDAERIVIDFTSAG